MVRYDSENSVDELVEQILEKESRRELEDLKTCLEEVEQEVEARSEVFADNVAEIDSRLEELERQRKQVKKTGYQTDEEVRRLEEIRQRKQQLRSERFQERRQAVESSEDLHSKRREYRSKIREVEQADELLDLL